MTLLRFVRSAVVFGAALILGLPGVRADQIFNVTIDTSSVSGGYTGPFALDFELTGLSGNTVTLSNFTFGNGGSAGPVGGGFMTGIASGDLSSTIVLGDTSTINFSDFNQQFTPGDTLSFTVDATTNGPSGGAFPDNFSAVILQGYDPVNGYDPVGLTGGTPVPTTDSTSDTFVYLDITNPQSDPMFYQVLSVPEPSSAALLVIGLFGSAAVVSRRRNS